MKQNIIPALSFFLALLIPILCNSQDNIILKNGNEIKAKVLEVTTDQIKYKKWDNQDGPTYSSAKSDVFMIKYKNGTKDVFSDNSNEPKQVTNNNIGTDKYSGYWVNTKNNTIHLRITKNGNDYIVISDDEGWENEKMPAKFENGDLNVIIQD